YAVGEWARVWPLQTLIRSMGAYFIRRNSKSPLYRRVLERYVKMATENGVAQAVFPEGGLTRDGTLRPPRMGLLDYMLRGFDPRGERDLVFVPVALNYDRVLEDRTLLLSADPDAPRRGALHAVRKTIGFLAHHAGLALRGRWHRFGYACVNFGTPVSARAWSEARGVDFRALDAEARFARVEEMARDLMGRIGALVPALPVPLVAAVLLEADAPLSALEVKARVEALIERLEAGGSHVYIPRRTRDYAIQSGIRHLLERRLVLSDDGSESGLFAAVPEQRPVLAYYANSIAHLLPGTVPAAAE
ncbi:MAG TPA: 1-acyl-sn-glycerol-3-phosphate acyltransferase, partial [Azospirillaceae bacterium]|nr:1-acyl-sn-glycerol-3-phosphate acyltransferase [Azospirillaceae bacterium]